MSTSSAVFNTNPLRIIPLPSHSPKLYSAFECILALLFWPVTVCFVFSLTAFINLVSSKQLFPAKQIFKNHCTPPLQSQRLTDKV